MPISQSQSRRRLRREQMDRCNTTWTVIEETTKIKMAALVSMWRLQLFQERTSKGEVREVSLVYPWEPEKQSLAANKTSVASSFKLTRLILFIKKEKPDIHGFIAKLVPGKCILR